VLAFQISALPREPFTELFSLSDGVLASRGAQRVVADAKPGYPCRVSLVDAEVGERLVLLSFTHQPTKSPYRSSGPIFVREAAVQARPKAGEVPQLLRHRLLSFRAYDAAGMMVAAETAQGTELESVVERLFGVAGAEYIHVHNAKPGCYNCRIDRIAMA
jgi:hypothetical protein